MRRSLYALLLVLCHTVSTLAAAEAQSLTTLPGQIRFTYDHMTLPAGEDMGLMGGNVLFEPVPWGYLGLGAYGAVSGDRGGFFTGGFAGGLRLPVKKYFWIDTGMFVGGGGGGAAPQGGGLMLRPHFGLTVDAAGLVLGGGVSQVRFPNGDIDSTQAYITAESRFTTLLRPGWAGDDALSGIVGNTLRKPGIGFKRRWFALQSIAYFPGPGTLGRDGRALDDRMDLVGVRWRQVTRGSRFVEFETAGAWGGKVDGFAQVLFGSGYYPFRSDNLALAIGAMLGGAGGGDVDTGGGAIYRIYAGLAGRVAPALWLTAEAGYTDAFDGDFAGLLATLGLTYSYEPLSFSSGAAPTTDSLGHYRWARWRMRVASQRYLPASAGARKSVALDDEPVDLIGLKADTWVSDSLFLSGQAWGAYRGGAGGYAVGLVGVGWATPPLARLQPEVEMLAGAAGGGGIAVGGGFIVQPMFTLSYLFGERFSGAVSYGYAKAPSSTFSAHVMEVSIAYRFATVHREALGR